MFEALIPGAASIIGGLIGADQAGDDRDAANNARNAALAQYANLTIPDIEAQKLALEQYVNAGVLSPELEQLIQMGPTAMEGISLDPMARQKQLEALEMVSGLAEGRVQPGDIAGFELAKREASGYDQAKQGQILQEMQQRGQGGSGAELLARLKSSQSSADRLQQADLEQARKMQEARMQALSNQANMAGNLRSQDYGEQSNLAKAQDMIAQFNAQNSQNVNSRNTGARNDAQRMNLQNAQQIGNMNVDSRNKEQQYNKGLIQTQFGNQMDLASGRAAQLSGVANSRDTQAGQTAGMWGGIGQGVGQAAAAYFNKDKK